MGHRNDFAIKAVNEQFVATQEVDSDDRVGDICDVESPSVSLVYVSESESERD